MLIGAPMVPKQFSFVLMMTVAAMMECTSRQILVLLIARERS